MSGKPKNNFIDLDQIRHDLSTAIGTLQTAFEELQSHAAGNKDAVELYEIGMQRLNNVLATLDKSDSETFKV